MSTKRQTRQRRRPAEILTPMLDTARRNRWQVILDALLTLLARWERKGDGDG